MKSSSLLPHFLLAFIFLLSVDVANGGAPNVLVLFIDDMGYGDINIQGNQTVISPRMNELAEDGVRFTQWLSGDSICTPSRGSLLTGRLPIRIGLASGEGPTRVFHPLSSGGLPHSEHTLAEALSERGYNTHITGKWHLGIGKDGEFLPTTHGFDHFYGLPITNLMTCRPGGTGFVAEPLIGHIWEENYPVLIILGLLLLRSTILPKMKIQSIVYAAIILYVIMLTTEKYILDNFHLRNQKMCLLHHDKKIIQQPVVLANLTQKFTANAESFIAKSVDEEKPFFLYMSYAKVHTALFTNPEFKTSFPNETEFPEYAILNNILELDWSVGAIVDQMKNLGVYENTIIWLVSDNGPSLETGINSGSASFEVEEDGEIVVKTLRGGKAQIYEGGFRVPGMVVYKEQFPSNFTSNEPVSTMDIFPTTLNIIDEFLQSSVKADGSDLLTYTKEDPHTFLDGKDISSMIKAMNSTEPQVSPHAEMFHYCGDQLSVVRLDGKYKLLYSTPVFTDEHRESCSATAICQCVGKFIAHHDPPLIIDLDNDIEEKYPLSPENFTEYDLILERARLAVEQHKLSIENFPNQPSEVTKPQVPWIIKAVCCDFPKCSCDKDVDPALAV